MKIFLLAVILLATACTSKQYVIILVNPNDSSSLSITQSAPLENVASNIRIYELVASSAILDGENLNNIQDIAKYFKDAIKEGYSLTIDENGEPIVKYVVPMNETKTEQLLSVTYIQKQEDNIISDSSDSDCDSIDTVQSSGSGAIVSNIRAYELAARTAILDGKKVNNIQDIAKYCKDGIKEGYSLTFDEYGEPVVKYTAPIDAQETE